MVVYCAEQKFNDEIKRQVGGIAPLLDAADCSHIFIVLLSKICTHYCNSMTKNSYGIGLSESGITLVLRASNREGRQKL